MKDKKVAFRTSMPFPKRLLRLLAAVALGSPLLVMGNPPAAGNPTVVGNPARVEHAAASPLTVKQAVPKERSSVVSEEARAALRKAIAYHRQAQDLSLRFKAKVYNSALDKNDEYQGKLLLKDSLKFRLEIPGGVYVSDGVTYWEYHQQNHQVLIRKAKDLEDKPLPGEVLLRFLDSDPLALTHARMDGKEYLDLRLDPSRAMKNLDSLAVLLDKGDFSLHRISSRDVSGNETQYTVSSIKRNGGLKDGEFSFTAPKGSDVVDMRE